MRARRTLAPALVLGALVALGAGRAAAEHAGRPADPDVALGFRLGEATFRVDGRFVTPDGFWGFWMDGARRDGALTVQGRVERDGRALNFSLDAERGARGTLHWWPEPY